MKIHKWLKTGLVGALAALSITALGACQKNDEFTGFMKGALSEVTLDEDMTFRPKDYVQIVGNDYTIILQKADGSWSKDVSKRASISPYEEGLEPGAYQLIYTVNGGEYKGTYTHNFNLVAPQLRVTYTLVGKDLSRHVGDTLVYQEYFSKINMEVASYYDYTIRPDFVWVGEETVDLTDTTEFTFTEHAQHAFHFTVVAEDEQEYSIMVPIKAALVAEEAETFMKDNDVVAYGYDEMTADMGVTFDAGFSRGGNNNRQNVPYFAFEGDYGAGNYVKIDFTGNNLPKIAFFSQEIKHMLNDGYRGLYVGNGHWHEWKKWQYDADGFTVYGPNKVPSGNFSSTGKDVLWYDGGADIAGKKLEKDPDAKYQYLTGFAETKDASQVAEGETPYCILEAILYNRESYEIVYECTQKIESEDFYDGYFSGNIVAYANFGYETTFDKIYPLQTATSIYDLYDGGPKFGAGAEKHAYKGAIYETSACAPDLSAGYVFGYVPLDKVGDGLLQTNDDGTTTINLEYEFFVDLTAETTFAYPEEGEYMLYYQSPDRKRPSQRKVSVTDVALIDFEDGIDTINVCETSSEAVSINGIVDVDGNKMMSVSGNWSTYIGVSAAYVHAVFTDTRVTDLQFKLYTDRIFATNVGTGIALAWYYQDDIAGNLRTEGLSYTDEGDYLLINWTRAGYSSWKESIAKEKTKDKTLCQFLFRLGADNGNGTANWNTAGQFYLDDFAAHKGPQFAGESATIFVEGTQESFMVALGDGVTDVKLNDNEFTYTSVAGGISVQKNILTKGINVFTYNDASGEPCYYHVWVLPGNLDFEDQDISYLSKFEADDKLALAERVSGNYAVRMTTSNWDFQVGVSESWLASIFADETVTAFSFKVYTTCDGYCNGSTNGQLQYIKDGKLVRATWGGYSITPKTDDGYFTITIPRKWYNDWMSAKGDVKSDMYIQLRLGNWDEASGKYKYTAPGPIYLDDFTAVKA